jgi:hypothetical protein
MGQNMNGGAQTVHHLLLLGLEPDTEHHCRVQGTVADGTLYVGQDGTFRTLPAEEKTDVHLASLEAGALSSMGGSEPRLEKATGQGITFVQSRPSLRTPDRHTR